VTDPLLQIRSLGVDFGARRALDAVSFEVARGETVGLVGESGSGKSTLARAVLRLIPVARGAIIWNGENLLSCDARALRRHRRDLQIVFQDPLASLNPRMTVGEALAEPLKIFEPSLAAPAREARVARMLERVGLPAATSARYPHEFSGGQCQRIGIARAMMLSPKLLVCDEPVSSLDVSIQGQIVNLLADLQREFGTAILFISHNLAVVRHLSHRVMVIYHGRIVEAAPCDALFGAPVHPYTRVLLAAVPDPTRAFEALAPDAAPAAFPPAGFPSIAEAEPPQEATILSGCAFRDRCSYAQEACAAAVPLLESAGADRAVACRRWRELPVIAPPRPP
jgi:oligopeptide transport system ATP-binding protein